MRGTDLCLGFRHAIVICATGTGTGKPLVLASKRPRGRPQTKISNFVRPCEPQHQHVWCPRRPIEFLCALGARLIFWAYLAMRSADPRAQLGHRITPSLTNTHRR